MNDGMLVLCPSRGRPGSAYDVLYTFENTVSDVMSEIRFIVDKDDPTLPDYPYEFVIPIEPQGKGMGLALNYGLHQIPESMWPSVLGFVGDDHRFRTKGWDLVVKEALHTPRIAYAFDGVRDDLPTNWFVHGKIVRALGWLSLPDCKHFFLDDAWRSLGNETGTFVYLPDILIEHMHYTYGKSSMDDTYDRNMGNWTGGEDQRAYEKWRNGPRFTDDVEKIRSVL